MDVSILIDLKNNSNMTYCILYTDALTTDDLIKKRT